MLGVPGQHRHGGRLVHQLQSAPRSLPSVDALRRVAQRPPDDEVCELCGAGISRRHPHLLDPAAQHIICACAVCATLFAERAGARFKRVPDLARRLDDFRLTDAEWDALHVPASLAFFVRRSSMGDVRATYPGPSGMIETLPPLAAWHAILLNNPSLDGLQPDIEALVLSRVDRSNGQRRMSLVAPIDTCHRLVDTLRKHWRGPNGGTDAWAHIDAFFADLAGVLRPARA